MTIFQTVSFKCPKKHISKEHTRSIHFQMVSSTYGAITIPLITHANSRLTAVIATKPIPNFVMFSMRNAAKNITTMIPIFRSRCRFDGAIFKVTTMDTIRSKMTKA